MEIRIVPGPKPSSLDAALEAHRRGYCEGGYRHENFVSGALRANGFPCPEPQGKLSGKYWRLGKEWGEEEIARRAAAAEPVAEPKRGYVDLGPVSWRQALPIYLASIENGSAEGRRMAIEHLGKMAKIADRGVHSQYLEDAAAFERDGDLEQAKEMRAKAERYAKAAGLEPEEVSAG